MNESLDTIIEDLTIALAAGGFPEPLGHLETLRFRLQQLAKQRPTHEELKALIGEGIHKSMRVYDAMKVYRAVDQLDDKTWDSILDYVVYGLEVMKVVDLRKAIEAED